MPPVFYILHSENKDVAALTGLIFHLFQGCVLWFLCHPVLAFISLMFNDYQRDKVSNMRGQNSLWSSSWGLLFLSEAPEFFQMKLSNKISNWGACNLEV